MTMYKSNKLFLLVLAVICAYCLFSCTSAPKHLAKAIAKDKPYVAEQTRLLWPCIVTGRDTVNTTDTVYDLIEAQCPDVDYTTPEGKTVYLPGKTVSVPGKTVTQTQYIEVKVKDSTEVYLLLNNLEVQENKYNEEIKKLQDSNVRLSKERKEADDSRDKWRKWCLITWGIIGLGIVGKILLTRFKPF